MAEFKRDDHQLQPGVGGDQFAEFLQAPRYAQVTGATNSPLRLAISGANPTSQPAVQAGICMRNWT